MTHDLQVPAGSRPAGAPDPTPPRRHRILVVDDCELVQLGLRSLLAGQDWVEACYAVGSPQAALEALRRTRPHVALIEMALAGQSGLHLARAMRAANPHVRIMLMSGQGRVSMSEALAHGACGFVSKNLPAAGVITAARRVAAGGQVFPRSDDESGVRLSPRERDVLTHIVRGLSNPEVAAQLYLSRHTVKQHTSALYRKLGVRNRAQAASRARELGLVA